MKINELLESEAVVTTKDETNKLFEEFLELLKDVEVTIYGLRVLPKCDNKSDGRITQTEIYSVITPKIENDEYDADEVNITLRLAHRLISKWLDQKEANGQRVEVGRLSKVGESRKFSTQLHCILTGSKDIYVPGFVVDVSIANKEETSTSK
jgi:hypothetical protein